MNNFVFSQDPILYNSTIPPYQQDPGEIKKQLDVVMAQYQQLQQSKQEPAPHGVDYLGELDSILINLDENDIQLLNQDPEFVELNSNIQHIIQSEIVNSIKWKINNNPEVSSKVGRLKSIINNIKKEREAEQRRSMNELNDYIQNYSDMTFNEYKKIKAARS
jgi:hypothetical protein